MAGLVGLFGIDLSDLAEQAPNVGLLTGVVCGSYVETPATNCPNTTVIATPPENSTTINYGMTTAKPSSSTKSSAQPTSTPPTNPGNCTLEPFTQALAMCNPNIMSDLGTIQTSLFTNPSAASGSLNNVFNSICSESCISSAGNALSGLVSKVRQG